MEDRKYGVKLFLYDEPELEKDIEFYQNDTNTCIINISLYRDRLTKYSVNGTVSIIINKNDGTVVVDTLTKVSEGDYTYILPNSAIDIVGNHSVTVQCHGTNNDRITFASFKYKVKSDVRSGDISSQSDYPILTKLISDNNELNQKVSVEENLRESNEEKRKVNEILRKQDYEKAIQEYESYKNVMIAESNVAALQNQINASNTQLAERALQSDLIIERNRITNLSTLSQGSTTGDAELIDGRIGGNGKTYSNIGENIREVAKGNGIIDKAITYNKTSFFKPYNYFNVINTVDGKLVNRSTGVISDLSTTCYIKINVKYGDFLNVYNFPNTTLSGNVCACYDSTGKYLYGVYKNESNFSIQLNVQNINYILLNCTIADKDKIMVFLNETNNGEYIKGGIYFLKEDIWLYNEKYSINPLFKKSALFIGDSLIEGVSNGGGWCKLIAERNSMTVTNAGIGGTTLSKRSGRTDDIVTRLDNYNEQYDYIFLEGGLNDYFVSQPLGQVQTRYDVTFDENTVCGALESLLKKATLKWKDKKIIFILCHKIENGNSANLPAQKQYWDKIEEILIKWGIPYVDLWKNCSINADIPEMNTYYFANGDKVHFNDNGYRYTIGQIESKAKNI